MVGGGGRSGGGGAHPKKLKCFFILSLKTSSDIITWLITRTKSTAARLK